MKLINIVIYVLIISIILILLYDYFKEENKVQIQDNPNVEGFYLPSKFGKIKNVQKNIDNVYFYEIREKNNGNQLYSNGYRRKKPSISTLYSFSDPNIKLITKSPVPPLTMPPLTSPFEAFWRNSVAGGIGYLLKPFF